MSTDKAPRNRTLTTTPDEVRELSLRLLTPQQLKDDASFIDRTINADLIEVLPLLPDQFADLIIIDPPYNLTKDFNGNVFTARSPKEYIDYVLTFFELQALFDSKDIVLSELEGLDLQDGSSFGRAYCRSGGVAASVVEAIREMGREDFEVNAVVCNGIDECKAALLKAKAGRLDGNIIEGMSDFMGEPSLNQDCGIECSLFQQSHMAF